MNICIMKDGTYYLAWFTGKPETTRTSLNSAAEAIGRLILSNADESKIKQIQGQDELPTVLMILTN